MPPTRRHPRRPPRRPTTPTGRSGSSGRTRVSFGGSWARTAPASRAGHRGRNSATRLRSGGGLAKGPDETVAILSELADLALHAARDLVDRDEERELAISQGVDDLAVATRDLEDADPVGDQLDLRQVLVQRGAAVQVVPCTAHTLEGHPVVEEGFDDLERDQVPERVQPGHPRTASGPLDGRCDQADLVPIPELTRGTPGEFRRLMCGESLHGSERPSDDVSLTTPTRSAGSSRGSLDVDATVTPPGKVRHVVLQARVPWQPEGDDSSCPSDVSHVRRDGSTRRRAARGDPTERPRRPTF